MKLRVQDNYYTFGYDSKTDMKSDMQNIEHSNMLQNASDGMLRNTPDNERQNVSDDMQQSNVRNNPYGMYDDVYVMTDEQLGNASQMRAAKTKEHFMFCTILIILANAIAGILCLNAENYFEGGGLNYEYITINKEYGRLISYMFLHGDFRHLFNNMVMLWFVGSAVEKKFGSLRTAIIYFGSGIGGGIFSVYLYHVIHKEKMRFAAGASAAVFGMMCAAVFLSINEKKENKKSSMIAAVIIVVIYALLSMGGNVDVYGHIGGAVFGGILTLVLCSNKGENFEEKTFEKLIGIVLTVGLCVVGIGEANIGKEMSQLPDERVDFAKGYEIYGGESITLGEALDGYCTNVRWEAFTSKQNEEIVDFSGEAYYLGKRVDVQIQFILQDNRTSCVACYFGLNGVAQGVRELNDFLAAASADYKSKSE